MRSSLAESLVASEATPAAAPARPPWRSRERAEALRVHALTIAGYPPALAYAVARRGGDLGLALRLAWAGCPPRLAAQIVC
jgi:hypothetical protein